MPESEDLIICRNGGKCPHAIIGQDCDVFVSEIKKDLELIIKHLGDDSLLLDNNSKKLDNINPGPNDILIEVLQSIKSIIVDQKTISENTVNTLNERLEKIEKENNKLKNKLKTDELTGLLNRNTIDGTFQKLAEAKLPFSVAILDIDNFKSINDTYGHPVGDAVLKYLAKVLIKNFNIGTVYRIGGEEFMIMIDINANLLKTKLDKILDDFKHTSLKHGELSFHISFSSGLKQYSGESTFHEIYEKTDKALYEVKHTGKNRVDIIN
ncbi:MAG: GGDEF domain-containing protein [Candidatus Gracilibacteria bacterium]|nr:GGDEF domain-containing protein [Candidatus Gracilibacteria bacterium]